LERERGWEKEVNGSRKRYFNGSRSRAQPPTVVVFLFFFYLFFSRGILEIPLSFDFETFQLKDKKNKKRVVGC
jgi:predicted RND superfamily exporter protein